MEIERYDDGYDDDDDTVDNDLNQLVNQAMYPHHHQGHLHVVDIVDIVFYIYKFCIIYILWVQMLLG